MLIALALHGIATHGVQALPISILDQTTPSSGDDLRTIWNIIWSCLITIFACTWIAVHPNIPGPNENSFMNALSRRLRLMVMVIALIAPELIVGWALRQWVVARRIAKQHQEHNWTQAHGYFALMGGFMLYEGDQALGPVGLGELSFHLRKGEIDISEEEINDRSKGDVLSKGLVIVQTGWFVLQCIARRVDHLPITELELVTLGFATLTFVMWWNKPLNVQCPVPVLGKAKSEHSNEGKDAGAGSGGREMRDESKPSDEAESWFDSFTTLMAGGDDSEIKTGAMRVPTFHAGELKDVESTLVFLAASVIATIFGAIHCFAWSFQFPSYTEQMLWRVAPAAITCLPLMFFFLELLMIGRLDASGGGLLGVLSISLMCMMITYCLARVVLLVLPLTSLRLLSPEAYQTVHWTMYIPHI